MKLYIDSNEWYPVYTLDSDDGCNDGPVEVTEEFYEKYKTVSAAFSALQKELQELYDKE